MIQFFKEEDNSSSKDGKFRHSPAKLVCEEPHRAHREKVTVVPNQAVVKRLTMLSSL